MDQCEAQRKAVRGFFQRNAYWLMVPITMTILVVLWGLWGLGGGQYFLDKLCKNDQECKILNQLASLGDVFGGVNALFAGLALAAVAISTDLARRAYTADRQWRRDEKYIEQIITSYKWAYSVLMDGKKDGPPKADRMNWSSCARHLLRAEKIFGSVVTPELNTILKEQREFWRHQFYLSLDYEVLKHAHYFSNIYRNNADPLDPTAALIVVQFSVWKDEIDPLFEVDAEALTKELTNSARISKAGLFEFIHEMKTTHPE
ncbi:hypothetical protein M2375_003213 [Comamonas sp. BIGb0152]|uniref:hypothetical protein n=1 Tax=Comamonas sp. BIGb0152 TaxID=2940601 RepID=UPI0021699F94|nr:hypothetical protein [Comamonas sp. BIGb0152]MCS4294980.1 hypothetical protein [Comamonas sp. BIGb0152]